MDPEDGKSPQSAKLRGIPITLGPNQAVYGTSPVVGKNAWACGTSSTVGTGAYSIH